MRKDRYIATLINMLLRADPFTSYEQLRSTPPGSTSPAAATKRVVIKYSINKAGLSVYSGQLRKPKVILSDYPSLEELIEILSSLGFHLRSVDGGNEHYFIFLPNHSGLSIIQSSGSIIVEHE